MLKISLAQTGSEYRILLEGPLVGAGLRELQRIGARVRTQLAGRTLVIHVKDANVISQEGENVPLQLVNQGAKLCPECALARCLLQQLARRSKKGVFDFIDSSSQDERPDIS